MNSVDPGPPLPAAAKGSQPPLVPETRWEGELVDRWARWWGIPRLEAFHAVESTNLVLRERALDGAPPFTVVTAETQSGGRGREGRSWHSPAGLGLWASVLVEVPGGPEALPVVPLRVGLALASAVAVAAPGIPLALKWPNDLLVRGRKAGGILCEVVVPPGKEGRVVVGVGLNLRQDAADFPVELRRTATSLAQAAGGRAPDRSILLGAFLSLLRDALRRPSGATLSEGEREALQRLDALRGRRVRVDPPGEGIARGIDASGALLLELADGEVRRVLAGSVRILEGGPGE